MILNQMGNRMNTAVNRTVITEIHTLRTALLSCRTHRAVDQFINALIFDR